MHIHIYYYFVCIYIYIYMYTWKVNIYIHVYTYVYIYIYNHGTKYSGSSRGSSGAPTSPRGAADRDAAAATAAATPVCCSMILYICIYINFHFLKLLMKSVLPMSCSNIVNYLLWIWCFRSRKCFSRKNASNIYFFIRGYKISKNGT